MSNNVKNKINNGVGERIGRIALYAITATLALLCLYPFLQVLISSFADEVTLTQPYLFLFCLVWWAFILFFYLLNISLTFHLVYIAVFGVAFP